jgi:hypothetical protein
MEPETNTQNSFSPESSMSPMRSVPEKNGSVGPIIGAIIVIALLVLGGFYFWGSYLNQNQTPEQLPLIVGDAAPAVQDNSDLSQSDTTATIEADVDSGYLDTSQGGFNNGYTP